MFIIIYLVISLIESIRCIYDAHRYGIIRLYPAWVLLIGALFDGLVWLPEVIWRLWRRFKRNIYSEKTES